MTGTPTTQASLFIVPSILLSIISLLAGILVMFSNTSSIVILTAVVMIIYAIADVIDEIIFINNVDKILE